MVSEKACLEMQYVANYIRENDSCKPSCVWRKNDWFLLHPLMRLYSFLSCVLQLSPILGHFSHQVEILFCLRRQSTVRKILKESFCAVRSGCIAAAMHEHRSEICKERRRKHTAAARRVQDLMSERAEVELN